MNKEEFDKEFQDALLNPQNYVIKRQEGSSGILFDIKKQAYIFPTEAVISFFPDLLARLKDKGVNVLENISAYQDPNFIPPRHVYRNGAFKFEEGTPPNPDYHWDGEKLINLNE